jgi:hypothetical protein
LRQQKKQRAERNFPWASLRLRQTKKPIPFWRIGSNSSKNSYRKLESPLFKNFDLILSKIQGYDNENVSSQERFSHLTTQRKKAKLF